MSITRLSSLFLVIFTSFSFAQPSFFYSHTPDAIKDYLKHSKPLTENELKMLVTGNSMIGHTCNSDVTYELYFEKNGTVLFRKAHQDKMFYVGKWWVKKDHIYSQWASYPTHAYVNELQFHHLMGNIYVHYNVKKACGPAGTFGSPFMVFEGDQFGLLSLKNKGKDHLNPKF